MKNTYPHMCRDGHVKIGHSDSEHEMCPLCMALAKIRRIEHTLMDDKWAMTFQSLGQYRAAMLGHVRRLQEDV